MRRRGFPGAESICGHRLELLDVRIEMRASRSTLPNSTLSVKALNATIPRSVEARVPMILAATSRISCA